MSTPSSNNIINSIKSIKRKLGVVVSYSSNESQFLRPLLRELRLCGDAVVVSVGSRMFDMSPELARVEEDERVSVARYDVGEDVTSNPRKYHNLARETGVAALRAIISSKKGEEETEEWWVLLLDADEIPEGGEMRRWFDAMSGRLFKGMAYKLACRWYFRSPTWRAKAVEDSIVLVHVDRLTQEALADPGERDGIVRRCPGGCMRGLVSEGGDPMLHHFSWVRSKEQALRKVRTWGHRGDRGDWAELVERFWSAPLDAPPAEGDFVHGYRYEVVPDRFGILGQEKTGV